MATHEGSASLICRGLISIQSSCIFSNSVSLSGQAILNVIPYRVAVPLVQLVCYAQLRAFPERYIRPSHPRIPAFSISISISNIAGLEEPTLTSSLVGRISSYTHTINAERWYDTASFSFAASKQILEYWLQEALGKEVRVYGGGLQMCWQGIINELIASLGNVQIRVGPLDDIVNRVIGTYNSRATNRQMYTSPLNKVDSQARYGIWYRALSLGECSTAEAEDILAAVLEERAYPKYIVEPAQSNSYTMTVNCVGFHVALEYPYSGSSITETITERIRSILSEEPNGWIISQVGNIEVNDFLVPRENNAYISAANAISTLAKLGSDKDTKRRIWGIKNGRSFFFKAINEEVDYLVYTAQGTNLVYTTSMYPIEPWEVLPGKWMKSCDALNFIRVKGDIYSDPNVSFIESVTYTMPYTLSISAVKIDRVSQLLARGQMTRGM